MLGLSAIVVTAFVTHGVERKATPSTEANALEVCDRRAQGQRGGRPPRRDSRCQSPTYRLKMMAPLCPPSPMLLDRAYRIGIDVVSATTQTSQSGSGSR